jgi:hypothetical protein
MCGWIAKTGVALGERAFFIKVEGRLSGRLHTAEKMLQPVRDVFGGYNGS